MPRVSFQPSLSAAPKQAQGVDESMWVPPFMMEPLQPRPVAQGFAVTARLPPEPPAEDPGPSRPTRTVNLKPSDPEWAADESKVCWECVRKYTSRGAYSSLLQKDFCTMECKEKAEKVVRGRRRALPAPVVVKTVACYECFRLVQVDTSKAGDRPVCDACSAGAPPSSSAPAARAKTNSSSSSGRGARACARCEGPVSFVTAVGVVTPEGKSAFFCTRACADAEYK
mmetsp:Transcript_12095/g.39783  ORF Transcript_12095/g.39783 Transcript_12095/m.39783 type:complete len:226 (+) Transcript_12095:143-820(+)